MKSKKQKNQTLKWFVKVARTNKALNSSPIPNPETSWMFWDKDYRRTPKDFVSISWFDSPKEAQKAIDKELELLRREAAQYKEDVRIVKAHGLDKRYNGLLAAMRSQISPYAIGKPPVFKIVSIAQEEWERLWAK